MSVPVKIKVDERIKYLTFSSCGKQIKSKKIIKHAPFTRRQCVDEWEGHTNLLQEKRELLSHLLLQLRISREQRMAQEHLGPLKKWELYIRVPVSVLINVHCHPLIVRELPVQPSRGFGWGSLKGCWHTDQTAGSPSDLGWLWSPPAETAWLRQKRQQSRETCISTL